MKALRKAVSRRLVAGAALAALANSALAANIPSTFQLPGTTTAYTAGQLMANSATGASVVVPSFVLTNQLSNEIIVPRLRLDIADATSTAWGGQTVTIDWWSSAPTFANGDRSTFLPVTGSQGHIASFTCSLSAVYGDGVSSECAPTVGTVVIIKAPSGTPIYWTAVATSGSGVTGANKVVSMTPEIAN